MPNNFPVNWSKALSEMEEGRNGWRASHDRLFQENKRLRAALDRSGIPTHAQGDPATTPPLRISVTKAREVMDGVDK